MKNFKMKINLGKVSVTLQQKGFTLTEMLVVMAIMGILTAVSIPLFTTLTRGGKLDGAARNITTALRTARSLAIVKRAIYKVDFYPVSRTYGIYDNDGVGLEKIFHLPQGIRFSELGGVSNPSAEDSLAFNPDGSTTETGSYNIELENTFNSDTKTITVYKATGTVRIMD